MKYPLCPATERTVPSGSIVTTAVRGEGVDRDVLPCLTMVRCVYELLTEGTRLEWLQRTNDDDAWEGKEENGQLQYKSGGGGFIRNGRRICARASTH